MNKHLKEHIKDIDKSILSKKTILKSDKSQMILVYVSTHVTILSASGNLNTFGGKWVK